jgi:hypothetical protein
LKTSEEIERNGGNYLIITDVFSRRSEQQVINRTGRLNNRGSWRYQLCVIGSLDSVKLVIESTQSNLHNLDHIKVSKLVALLEGIPDSPKVKSGRFTVKIPSGSSDADLEPASESPLMKKSEDVELPLLEER